MNNITCIFCGYDFPAECGKYGCPNCEATPCNHAYDETGTCFECGERETAHFLPDWLKYLADTCPEDEKI
jgi:hypothetical protein